MQLSQLLVTGRIRALGLLAASLLASTAVAESDPTESGVTSDESSDPNDGAEEVRRAALAAVQAGLAQDKPRLIVGDSRLDNIASWIAVRADHGGASRSDVRARLWQEGIPDYDFVPIAARGTEREVLAALQVALSDSAVDWSRYNNIGVAARALGEGYAVGVLATRRSVLFAGTAEPRNQAYLGGDYKDMKLYATDPAGNIEERSAQVENGLWTLDLRTEAEGSWIFEIIGEGKLGPEILALWPRRGAGSTGGGFFKPKRQSVEVPDGTATDAASWVRGGAPGPDRSPTPADAAAAEEHLWRLIQATRASRGLAALQRLPDVVKAARSHASDIGRGDSFGHYTSSGSALDRLANQGVLASRVVENVGRASDVAAVHAAFLASPAHRANILDPEVEAGGVGVVLQRDTRGRWTAIASEVLVELLPDTQTREAELAEDVNQIRRAEGLLKLKISHILSKEARAAAETIASSGGLALSSDAQSSLVERTRFHFVSMGRVGIDVLVTNDRHAGADIHHVRGRTYDEVGVGATRLLERIGTHPPGTLVTVFVFVER